MRTDKCETIEDYIDQIEKDLVVLKDLAKGNTRDEAFSMDRYNNHRDSLENHSEILSKHREFLRRKENNLL